MDAFVKAARQHFNDENIGTKELFKLMENGELLSKDILPLVGKHMAAAAKKGGALEKMLVSNGVAMRRLTQTWQNFQNEFFKGGFGTALTDTFNTLAQMLKDNTGLAKMMGAALGAVMNNLLDGFTMVYDIALLFWLDMDYYLFQHIPQGMKDFIADWAAIGAAVVIATGIFKGMYGILKMIFGFGSLGKALGLGAAASDATKIGGAMSLILRVIGKLTTAALVLESVSSSFAGDKTMFDFSGWIKGILPGGTDIQGLNNLKGNLNPNSMLAAPFRTQPQMSANWATAGQQGSLKVEIIPKDSEFGKAIEARIVENDNKNFNMAPE